MKHISFFIVSLFILAITAINHAEDRLYTVTGDSMSPALFAGDKVLVTDGLNGPLQKGDLVAIKFRHSPVPLVKRVVAVPGDRLKLIDNTLYVNDKKHGPFNADRWNSTINQLKHYGWTIPEKHVFILGDNPVNSRDSRRLGLISVSQIEGNVVSVNGNAR